ncbi:hypothetical protein WA1_07860 [Scytonema hofmannii PCC 7110]|uniref:Uncharacterized protein n=1 Tax=Scytonema hofmannii PCC 7110 TaxID=128403 RepID=A0A139WTF7_9CYAN|nr:hypothetical protein [Scytonema hofmannii]KYC35712.1 hypothetical protein WA1_07860 [Scytonema hofmannii PCC 7110]
MSLVHIGDGSADLRERLETNTVYRLVGEGENPDFYGTKSLWFIDYKSLGRERLQRPSKFHYERTIIF